VTAAVRSVKFYGVLYDRDLMTATQEVEKISAQVISIYGCKLDTRAVLGYKILHNIAICLNFQQCKMAKLCYYFYTRST